MPPAPARASRRAWWAVGVWLVFQLTLTSLPGRTLPPLPGRLRLDWLAHFCLYFGLGVLIARAGVLGGWDARRLALVWVAIAIFGVLDEWHEAALIPDRSAELMDWIMDSAGSWCGLAVAYSLLKRTRWAAKLLR